MKTLAVLLFALIIGITANVDLTLVKVEPKAEDCFYQDFEAGTTVHLETHVLDGGLFDIEIRLFGGVNNFYTHLYYEGRDPSTYSFVTGVSGPHGFCFNNEMSRWTVKTLNFKVTTDKKAGAPGGAEPSAMQKSLDKIESDFAAIEREQSNYRVREHMHRQSADATNSKVYMWSLFESTVLVLMCLGQVFYLRKLFEDKRR